MPRRSSGSSGALIKFLRKHSRGKGKGDGRSIFKQWQLIEVRDVGFKKNLICPCGRSGLRYLCFIRNYHTKVQTYVGSTCIRHFSNTMVLSLLNTIESLSINGISGKYLGRAGNKHRFLLRHNNILSKRYSLMSHFFRSMPITKTRNGFVIKILMGKSKKKFVNGSTYRLNLGSVTSGSKNKKPSLNFFADKAYRSG